MQIQLGNSPSQTLQKMSARYVCGRAVRITPRVAGACGELGLTTVSKQCNRLARRSAETSAPHTHTRLVTSIAKIRNEHGWVDRLRQLDYWKNYERTYVWNNVLEWLVVAKDGSADHSYVDNGSLSRILYHTIKSSVFVRWQHHSRRRSERSLIASGRMK